jgi:hypothetical protein
MGGDNYLAAIEQSLILSLMANSSPLAIVRQSIVSGFPKKKKKQWNSEN